jgi:mannose-6-phosphate isomerase
MKKIHKPWGHEILIEKNKHYMFKELKMNKGHQCSLQLHNKKIETIYVIKGNLRIYIGKNQKKLKSKIYKPGQIITIYPKTIHRMKAESTCVYLEASTPELKDVVRLEDDYSRV